MNIKKFIEELEEILDVEEGTLEETTDLTELDEWDSISKLSVIIFADEELGKKISGDDLKGVKTVSELVELLK